MSGGCASVGKPGYGCVTTGRGAVSCPSDVRRTADAVVIIAHPASESESRTVEKCAGSTSCSSTSPPQAAAAHRIVAATMRSGMIVCSTNGRGRETADRDRGRARAGNVRAELAQVALQVGDLRLACGVADDRLPRRCAGSEHGVFRRADARKRQQDAPSLKRVRPADDVAAALRDLRAERAQRVQVPGSPGPRPRARTRPAWTDALCRSARGSRRER